MGFFMKRARGNVRGRQQPILSNQVLSNGFDHNPNDTLVLHYTERPQPDLGGGLNYSYDLYALPLNNITGAYFALGHNAFRTVTPASGQWQQAPVTAMGGNITGIFYFQPLLDPFASGTGYDIYGD